MGYVKFSSPVAQAPNARLGHIHASMAATLALRICANILNIRYINAARDSLSNGESRLFFILKFRNKGTPLTSTGRKKRLMEAIWLNRLMFRHVLDHYSDVILGGVSGMGSEFAKEDYRNFLQYLSYVIPDEYAPHKEMYEEELRIAEDDEA